MSHLEMAVDRARSFDRGADAPAWVAVELLARVRELENRANLVAGLAQRDPDLQGQFRAAVFILTGSWPGNEVAS